jgi:hypothetical protein
MLGGNCNFMTGCAATRKAFLMTRANKNELIRGQRISWKAFPNARIGIRVARFSNQKFQFG